MSGSLTDEQTDAIAADFEELTTGIAATMTELVRGMETYLIDRDDPDVRFAMVHLATYQQELPRLRKGLVWFRSAPAGDDGSKEAVQFGKASDWIIETLEKGVALLDQVAGLLGAVAA